MPGEVSPRWSGRTSKPDDQTLRGRSGTARRSIRRSHRAIPLKKAGILRLLPLPREKIVHSVSPTKRFCHVLRLRRAHGKASALMGTTVDVEAVKGASRSRDKVPEDERGHRSTSGQLSDRHALALRASTGSSYGLPPPRYLQTPRTCQQLPRASGIDAPDNGNRSFSHTRTSTAGHQPVIENEQGRR